MSALWALFNRACGLCGGGWAERGCGRGDCACGRAAEGCKGGLRGGNSANLWRHDKFKAIVVFLLLFSVGSYSVNAATVGAPPVDSDAVGFDINALAAAPADSTPVGFDINALAASNSDVISAASDSVNAAASDSAPAKKRFNIARIFSNTAGSGKDPNFKAPKIAFVLGPGIYFTPETSLAFVIGGQLFFDQMDKTLTSTSLDLSSATSLRDSINITQLKARRSNLLMGFKASLRKQFAVEFTPSFYFLNKKLLLDGFLTFNLWPNNFWGIGSDSKEEDKTPYEQIYTTIDLKLLYEVARGLFVGPAINYHYYWITKKEPGLLTNTVIYGQDKAQGLGFGASLFYDTRDNNVRPLSGSNMKLDAIFNTPTFGHSKSYGKIKLNASHYFHIPQYKHSIDHVFALNLFVESSIGKTIPFENLAPLGGLRYARGILWGRYLDKNAAVFQIEYRFYYKWLGFVVFGCAADIGNNILDALHFSKLSYGLGVRLKPFKNLPFTIRGDMGVYKCKPQFYVGINEIF